MYSSKPVASEPMVHTMCKSCKDHKAVTLTISMILLQEVAKRSESAWLGPPYWEV